MNDTCEHLKRRALQRGENSPEYAVWVRHSRHCEDCRNDLYILGLLHEDVRSRSARLSSQDVNRLVQLAQDRYRGCHRSARLWSRLWGVSWRVAGFAASLCLLMYLIPQKWFDATWATLDGNDQSDEVQQMMATLKQQKAVTPGLVPLAPAEEEQPAEQESSEAVDKALEAAEDFSMDPEILPGWELDGTIDETRSKIDRQQERMADDLNEDSGEWW